MRRFFSSSMCTSFSIASTRAAISAFGLPSIFEAEADVLGHRHVRKQRVGLEHRVDRPLERRQRRDVLAVEQDFAIGRIVEAGDQPQKRGLSAAGRAEQREELVLADRDRDIVERLDRVLAGSLKNPADALRLNGGPDGYQDSPLFLVAIHRRTPAGQLTSRHQG